VEFGWSADADDLERFARAIGPFGVDPYFDSIPGHEFAP